MSSNLPRRPATAEDRLQPLLELTRARLREFFRERGMIFWVFGFPLLMAVGLGMAFRNRLPERPLIAVLSTPDARSAAWAQKLTASSAILAEQTNEEQALRGLMRAKYALIADLRTDEPVYRYDSMRADARLARALTDAELQRAAGQIDLLSAKDAIQSVPGTRYIDFLIPGLIGMNVMGSSVWSIGYSLVVARKRKLLRRFAVTGMRRSDFLLSYFLARALFLILEVGLLVAFGALAFGTRVQGSYFALSLVALVGAAAFAGLGLLVGARVDNTEVAQGWMNFIQLPMWVLSGAFFSNARFPEWFQPVIQALPLTALVDALRLIYNEAAQLPAVLPDLAILTGWALAAFLIAGRTFRWQ